MAEKKNKVVPIGNKRKGKTIKKESLFIHEGANGLAPRQGERISIRCLIEALAKFKVMPSKPGETYFLMVETMDHKIRSESPHLGSSENEISYVSVKLVAVLYQIPGQVPMLSWEVEK